MRRSSDGSPGTEVTFCSEAEAALSRLRADQEASMAQFPLPQNGTPSPPTSALNGGHISQLSTSPTNVNASHVNVSHVNEVVVPLQTERDADVQNTNTTYNPDGVVNIVPMVDSDVVVTTEDSESMDIVHSNAEQA